MSETSPRHSLVKDEKYITTIDDISKYAKGIAIFCMNEKIKNGFINIFKEVLNGEEIVQESAYFIQFIIQKFHDMYSQFSPETVSTKKMINLFTYINEDGTTDITKEIQHKIININNINKTLFDNFECYFTSMKNNIECKCSSCTKFKVLLFLINPDNYKKHIINILNLIDDEKTEIFITISKEFYKSILEDRKTGKFDTPIDYYYDLYDKMFENKFLTELSELIKDILFIYYRYVMFYRK